MRRVRARPPSVSTMARSGTGVSPVSTPRQSFVWAAPRSSPTSKQIRSIVLGETWNSCIRFRARDARFSERVSAFRITRCRLNPGVDSRASSPKATR